MVSLGWVERRVEREVAEERAGRRSVRSFMVDREVGKLCLEGIGVLLDVAKFCCDAVEELCSKIVLDGVVDHVHSPRQRSQAGFKVEP